MINKLYRATVSPDGGVRTEEWDVVRETKSNRYCISPRLRHLNDPAHLRPDETPAQSLRRRGVRLKRVPKRVGIFAFETEEKAFAHLLRVKREEMVTTQRAIGFLNKYAELGDGKARAVHNALIDICMDEPCAGTDDLCSATGLNKPAVLAALRELVRCRKACTITDVSLWTNPIDPHGRPLVCGAWCGEKQTGER